MRIIIETDSIESAPEDLRYVAKEIEQGYYGDIVGCTGNNWEIEQ